VTLASISQEVFMHAVVVTVNIAAGKFEGARKVLQEEVVPRAKKAPGLVKGYWTVREDEVQGISLLVFDSKEHADGAAEMVRGAPPPPGVTLSSIEVREVVAEA
jgi:hypothetical protein